MKQFFYLHCCLFVAILSTMPFWVSAQSLDNTFNKTGKVTANFTKRPDYIRQVFPLPDGKTIAVGVSEEFENNSQVVARYNADGMLDTTFGIDGTVYGLLDTVFSTNLNPVSFIDANNKIVVADDASSLEQNGLYGFHLGLLRFNANGTMDSTFGKNGKVITILKDTSQFGFIEHIEGFAPLLSGKFLAIINLSYNNRTAFAFVRYNNNGSIDSTYGDKGVIINPLSNDGDASIARVKVEKTSGKILLLCNTTDNDSLRSLPLLVRYDTNGKIDTTFGNKGKSLVVASPNGYQFGAFDFQSDAKILLYGGNEKNVVLIRLSPLGKIDTTFGTKGVKIISTGAAFTYPSQIGIQTDNKIVITGFAGEENFANEIAFFHRYLPSGAIDATFGSNNNGVFNFKIDNSDKSFNAISDFYFDTNQRIVAGGYSATPLIFDGFGPSLSSESDFLVLCINSNGALNYYSKANTSESSESAAAVFAAIPYQGGVLAAGFATDNQNSDFAILKLLANGGVDSTFERAGKVTTDFKLNNNDVAAAILEGRNKSFIVGGSTQNRQGRKDFALAKYDGTGELFSNFGVGLDRGVITKIGEGNSNITALAKQGSNDHIIAVGTSVKGGLNRITVARYDSTGVLDTLFGTKGIAVIPFGTTAEIGGSVAVLGNQKIVVTGMATDATGKAGFGIARLNANGSLDTTFGTKGKTQILFPNNASVTLQGGLVVDSLERCLLSGTATRTVNGAANSDFAVARFLANGKLDTTFGTKGMILSDFATNDAANAIVLQKDKKIIVTGFSNNQFAAARYSQNGILDTTFRSVINFGTPESKSYTSFLEKNAEEKLVIAGFSKENKISQMAIARVLTSGKVGTLDFSALEKNSLLVYPNPIATTATFEYELTAAEASISIQLFDIEGRLVQSFVQNQYRAAGKHQQAIELNPSLSQGIYLLRFSNGKGSQAVKIVH